MKCILLISVAVILLVTRSAVCSSIPPIREFEVETCWYSKCLPFYAKFALEVFEGVHNYTWTILDVTRFGYALQYFAKINQTPIPAIRKALIVCKQLGLKTEVTCRNRLDALRAKGFTIDHIFDYCSLRFEYCLHPDTIIITCDNDVKFAKAEVDIYRCLPHITSEDDLIVTDNLRLAFLKSMVKYDFPKIRCDCYQTYYLAEAYRSIQAQLDTVTDNEPNTNLSMLSNALFTKSSLTVLDKLLMSVCITNNYHFRNQLPSSPKVIWEIGKEISHHALKFYSPVNVMEWLVDIDVPVDKSAIMKYIFNEILYFYQRYYEPILIVTSPVE